MKCRIVRDRYAGYEIQVWRWWWPFWVQPFTNTSATVEQAEALAQKLLNPVVKYITPTTQEPTDHE